MIQYTYTTSGIKISRQLINDGNIGDDCRYMGPFVFFRKQIKLGKYALKGYRVILDDHSHQGIEMVNQGLFHGLGKLKSTLPMLYSGYFMERDTTHMYHK